MSGWLLLALGVATTLIDVAIGLFLLRQGGDERGLTLETPPATRLGRLILFISPLFLIVFAALAFGAIPVEGIEPVELGGGR